MKKLLCAILVLGSTLWAGAEWERDTWLSVANKLITTQPESYPFNWGEGVQMVGMMNAWERTKDPRYLAFVEQWAAHQMPQGLDELLMNTAKFKRQGYCGPWIAGAAFAYLFDAKNNPEYLKLASGVAQHIRAGATRSPEGLPGHWTGNYQMWVDTLFMTAPLLSRLAVVEKKPAYLDDVVNQTLVSAKHMRDARTGLFYHMWDWQLDKRSEVQWARGNGWVVMSIADIFEYLPKTHPQYNAMKDLALDFSKSLVAAQDKDGLLHTVMNDQSSYAESSASTMLAYGLLKLVRLGVLPAKFREPARRAWSAVNARWVKDGVVTGVSAGTSPWNKDEYAKLATGTFTWGTGSYLMAGSEMDRWLSHGR